MFEKILHGQKIGTPPKKIEARFYQGASGVEPVRDWLKELADSDRKIIGQDIATVEYGWPIGMPVCRAKFDHE